MKPIDRGSRIALVLCLFILLLSTPILTAQKDCDTDLGSIDQKGNDCAPCANGMEKLLAPFLLKRDIDAQMRALQAAIDDQLDYRQDRVDQLMDMQGQTDRVLDEWGVKDLNGRPLLSKDGLPETQYLQNTIDDLKEFIQRFSGQTEWLNEMVAEFENVLQFLDEARKLKEQSDNLANAIRDGEYGDLGNLEFDCCPDAVESGDFDPDAPADLQRLIDDLAALNERYRSYRSQLADQIFATTQSMISLLSQRAEEEQDATERRDQFADGLTGFLGAKIEEGVASGLNALLESMGLEPSSEVRGAIDAFSRIVSTIASSTGSGGGLGGTAASTSSQIIDMALEGMEPADREAITMLSDAVLSEIASRVVDKIFQDAIKNSVLKFLVQGAQGASIPLMLFDKTITVPLYLWAERDMLILRGGFDRILLGQLKSIRLMDAAARYVPQGPYDAYIDALGTVEICLLDDPAPGNAEAMKRALLEKAFPGQNVTSLGEGERAEMNTDRRGIRFMEYMVPLSKYSNKRLRCKVRFDCYCGNKVKKIYTTEPSNAGIAPGDIRSTGESIGPVAEATVSNPHDYPVEFRIGPGLITSDGVHQPYIIPRPIVIRILPGQSVSFPIDGVCVRDDMPPFPEGHPMTPVDSWIPVTPGEIPRGPDIYNPVTPIDVVNRPEEATPVVYEITVDVIETVDSLSNVNGIPKTPLSNNPERERNSLIQQVVWNEVVELEDRPGRKPGFISNAHDQVSEQMNLPYETLPEETKDQIDTGLEQIWDAIVLIGAEAKLKPRNTSGITESSGVPAESVADCPCDGCTITPLRIFNATDNTEVTDSMPWHNGDVHTAQIELHIPVPGANNPCPDDCAGDQNVEIRAISNFEDSRLNDATEWSSEALSIPLLGPGEVRIEVRYTCFCATDTCDEQTVTQTITLTEPNDCCDEIRQANNGALIFNMGNNGSVEIVGNSMRVVANGEDQMFEFDQNIEALFCHLRDEQIVGINVSGGSSSASGANLDEQHASSDLQIGHTSEPTSGPPHYTIKFSQTVNGEEFQISLTINEEQCVFDASGLVNDRILEHVGPPIYTPAEFSDYLDQLFDAWRGSDVYIARSENNAAFRRWLQAMMFAYLQIQKAQDDPAYAGVAGQWRNSLLQALEFELANDGLSGSYKQILQPLLEALQNGAGPIEIVRALINAAY